MPKVVDHEERRRELIAATWAVIAADGFDAVTLRRVAAEAGCTTGRITHYFADRDDLLVAALRRAHDAAGTRMLAAVAAENQPRARLRAVLHHSLPLDARSTAEWKVWIAFWGVATSDRRLVREDARRYVEWTALVTRLVDGLVTDEQAPETAAVLIAVVDGLGVRGAVHPTATTRRMIVATLDRVLESVGPLSVA